MKIAINCAFYQPKGGGIKEYIHNLTNNLALIDQNNEYILYVLEDQIDFAKKGLPENFRIKIIPFKSSSIKDKVTRSLFEQNFWTKEEKTEKFDIFHSPFFHAPSFRKARLILTVHDLRFYRYPSTYTFLRYNFLKYKVRESVLKADHIISISHFTKKELLDAYNLPEKKITVIHEAINRNQFSSVNIKEPDDIPSELHNHRFLLTVGHLEPRKNYNLLIDSFRQIKSKKNKDLKLVIVGKKGHDYEETLKKIETDPDIYYLDFVSNNTLLWLYKNASLFIFPSFYEGFGFPPMEAAALGTLSAVSNISSIPEVCGNAAFYFNPFNLEEMTVAIESALEDNDDVKEKKTMIESQLDKFSWERNARETLELYNKIMES